MIYRLFISLMLVVLFKGQSTTDEVLEWQEKHQLKWSNFQGQPKSQGDVVALTASGISFEYAIHEENGKAVGFSSKAEAHFYPQRSWVHKERSSDHILAHEQLHFDITEVHVRKFRKEISQLNISKQIKQNLNRTYQGINRDMAAMQNMYDLETNHSRDTIAQAVWKQKIENALADYSDYKKTEISVRTRQEFSH
ncbi:DUF922 domain-containing protein [Gelidibacter mesophilus]|uniref:DUF922 domain-containing protein n=1 Tax=Gelidibacter mesophilus TaxID=169050 RepID=UPI00040ED316|nr:DUF922 domain-containing protein [Gelidibacter mesophilus]